MSAKVHESVQPVQVSTTVFDQLGKISLVHLEPEMTIRPEEIYGSIINKDPPNIRQKLAEILGLHSIAICFDKVTDGRPYSLALRLREIGFRGEIHAVGSVNQEILHHLVRVGFTHVHLSGGAKAVSPEIVRPFSFEYQKILGV